MADIVLISIERKLEYSSCAGCATQQNVCFGMLDSALYSKAFGGLVSSLPPWATSRDTHLSFRSSPDCPYIGASVHDEIPHFCHPHPSLIYSAQFKSLKNPNL